MLSRGALLLDVCQAYRQLIEHDCESVVVGSGSKHFGPSTVPKAVCRPCSLFVARPNGIYVRYAKLFCGRSLFFTAISGVLYKWPNLCNLEMRSECTDSGTTSLNVYTEDPISSIDRGPVR